MSNKQHYTDQDQYRPNFEELLSLAKNDPESFEAKRLEYIEHFFTKVPVEKQQRLRGLQWQIDQARNLARTPMSSCLNLMDMMWSSLSRLSDQQQTLVQLTLSHSNKSKPSAHFADPASSDIHKGKVIPFPTR